MLQQFVETCVVTREVIYNAPLCLHCGQLSLQVIYVVNPEGCVETFGTKILLQNRIVLNEDTLLLILFPSIYHDHQENSEIYLYL